jgi:hypothetical protein
MLTAPDRSNPASPCTTRWRDPGRPRGTGLTGARWQGRALRGDGGQSVRAVAVAVAVADTVVPRGAPGMTRAKR